MLCKDILYYFRLLARYNNTIFLLNDVRERIGIDRKRGSFYT